MGCNGGHQSPAARPGCNTILLTINATFFFSNKWDRHICFVYRVDVWGVEMNGRCWRAVAEDEFQLKNRKNGGMGKWGSHCGKQHGGSSKS